MAEGAMLNVPDEYTSIQEAITNAKTDDVIIVSGGPYDEQITVDKRLNITGIGMPEINGKRITGKNTVTLNAAGTILDGFLITNGGLAASGIEITSDDVGVRNCTVTNNRGTGIEINTVNGVIFRDNVIRDNVGSSSLGIYLNSSTNCLLQNNIVENNNVHNLELDDSSYNIIHNNTFSSAGWYGILLSSDSQYNTFSENVIEETADDYGVWIYSTNDHNVFRSNIIRNNSGGIVTFATNNLTFTDNILSGNRNYGMYLDIDDSYFANNTITNTIGEYDPVAVYLESSESNTLENNTIADNEYRGLFLKSSRYNTLIDNNITGNPYNFGVAITDFTSYFINYIDTSNLVDGKPIIYLLNELNPSINGTSNAGTVYCINCEGATVEGLTLSNNSYGILFSNSFNSTIESNTVHSCEEGIVLTASNNNTITNNNASNNQDYGIRVKSSNSNSVYLNDFTNNGDKDYISDSSTLWISPVELLYYFAGNQNTSYLGNHWGSYTVVDSDNNGINDTTFTITGDANNDDYPLIASKTAYSFAPNQPPSASFTYLPLYPDTEDTISFTDSSTDIDGSITAWLWNFGDGDTSSNQNTAHQYSIAGFYQVQLDVTDDQMATGNTTCKIFVHDAGPMTIYVPDNFTTIQEAINFSRDGDTVVVRQGTYPENVVVNRSITLTGEGMPLVTASDGNGITVTSPDCTIEGFNVSDFDWDDYAGIKLLSDRNTVRNNVLYDNDFGIWLILSDNNSIFNNTCTDNHYSGIQLTSAMNNTIYNNTCNSNSAYVGGEGGDGYGIMLEDSGGNILYFNDMDNPSQMVPGTYYNAFDSNTSAIPNQWFNATILKGNRYSDYGGEDGNNDGIGDSDYEIACNLNYALASVDPYPLMPYNPLPDYEPVISSIWTSDLTHSSINIRWSILNDVNSDNRILYGTSASLAGSQWSAWDNSSTSPQIALTGLAQNTTYYYSCYSYNSKNTTLVDNSSIRSFTTIQRQNMILTVDDDDSDIPEPPANYSSLSAALSAAIDGDTILVYNGTYMANHIVDKSVNITGIGKPLLIGSNPDTYSELGNVVVLEANDCILQGFRISEAHWTYPNIYGRKDSACVRIDSDRNVVRNNILEDGVYGIYVSTGSNYNRITSNLLNDTYDGVLFDYARNNVFSDNELTNIDRYPVMLDKPDYMSYDYYPSTNNTISNNILSDTGFSYGITVGGVSDNTIADNTLSYSNRIWINGDRNSVTGNSVQGPHDHHDAGIQLGSGEDNSLSDNTVAWQRFGILLEPDAKNVTMRNNRMENNTYNFGFTGDWYYAGHMASTHDIDTSNTVDGNPIYYLVGEEDAVYSYSTLVPSPGYLACIDCSNITIKDFYLEKNAQGLFLYNTTDSRIDSVTTISNGEYGMLLHETDNLVITDSGINGNGQESGGIFLEETSGCLIDNCEITGNNEIGIKLWYGCPDTVIRNSEITNNGDPTEPGGGIGIYISGSYAENVTIHSNIIANTYAGLQGTGIQNWAKNSTIYNNYFDNTEPSDVFSAASGTVWNITPTIGTNIIGGPWIAGNYWEDYTGVDSDGDGLGDTLVPYTADGEIQEAGDYHPLLDTFVPDSIAPVLHIISPEEGKEYIPQYLRLEVFSPDPDAAYWWYSLNGAENVSFVPNSTLTDLPLGENNLTVYLNDTSGNMNSSVVNFTVAEDHTAPGIYIMSPENGSEYKESRDVPLEVWSPDEDVFSWWCSLDGGSNTSFTPNATLIGLANGVHTLIVYADDVVGNTNSSQATFTVNVNEEENPPSGGGGGSGTGSAVIISPGEESSEEEEEEEEELPGDSLIVLSPEEGRTVSRDVELRYACTVPLARAYYSLDEGTEKEVEPLAPVPVDRLKLGEHIFRVTGVDYEGNRYHASAKFEVIPLALGEKPDVGSPEYPDEAVYAFNGRAVNYTLTFEASGLEEEELGLYINRYLSGSVAGANGGTNENANETGNSVPVLSLHESGGLLGTLNSSAGDWKAYGYTIPANRIVPKAENFLSFIHQINPGTASGSDSWHVRNVALVPEMPLSYPRIRVFTPDRALSPEDEMMVWVDISGIGEAGGSSAGSYSGNGADGYEASVYVVGPDGTVFSFPDGETAPVPLAQSYLEENHYGRIPGAMAFDESFLPGTYTLVGILSSLESGKPVSISSEVIYYSDQPSVKIFLNRKSFYPGMPLTIEAALTEGKTPESVSVLTRLERPAGADLFLPEKTGTFSMLNYAPLEDGYMTLYNEPVNGNWENGTYVVKCSIFNESGYELASDVLSFEVSTAQSELSVRFDMPEDTLFPVVKSNIRLIDAASFGVIAEKSTTGPQSSVDLQAPPGTYWIAGVIYTENGEAYRIPVSESNRVELGCDEKRTKRVSVSRISFVDFVNMLNEEVEA
ncbi:hypothetical protein MSMTP_1105 [Methanosarcina sp. MTP4]|uniref:NosD domain-containing protein n=1 Tax=Methanosarcina sp. MTP4 TaxID=1434100 RepID=UPI000615CAEC|nr:NosD domain-containing protein [Methanosarcina sp. MTP4]AKB24574.1 hypothetical protein MSMTP_1105 [Methanosarcina sp. MTP4]